MTYYPVIQVNSPIEHLLQGAVGSWSYILQTTDNNGFTRDPMNRELLKDIALIQIIKQENLQDIHTYYTYEICDFWYITADTRQS